MRSVRVLAVIDTLNRGGAETLILHLAAGLRAEGVALEVASLTPPDDLAPELEEVGVKVHRLGGTSGWRAESLVPRLADVVVRTRPDIIHAHLFFSAWTVAWLPRIVHSCPRLLSLHAVDYIGWPARTAWRRVRKELHKQILKRRMDGLVAVSQAVADHYRREMGALDIDVVYNALPVASLRAAAENAAAVRTRFGFDPSDQVVLTVGRFTDQKGHVHLIDAAARLRQRWPRLRVGIVGLGPLESAYHEQIARARLETVVTLVPPMPHPELMALVAACDVFTMPSVFEGFGIATAEAMALGRPTVVSDIPPFLEFVTDGETGIVVKMGDPQALADGLQKALSDPERAQRIADAGRRHVIDRFDTPVIAARWASYYNATLDRFRSRGSALTGSRGE